MATSGGRGETSMTDSVIDLTVSPSFHPGGAEVEQEAQVRTSAAAGPSGPGPSRPSTSVQIPVGAGSQGPPDTESLGEGTALGDPTMAISLF